MNSTGLESPKDRKAVARVAGKALGTTVMDVRRRGQVMVRDAIDTIFDQFKLRASQKELTNIDFDPLDRWQRHHRVCCSRFPW